MKDCSVCKIWFVNPYALPPAEVGGTRHHSLAKYCIRHGCQSLVITSNVHYLSRRRLPYRGNQTFADVPFVWLDVPLYRSNGPDRLWNSLVFTLRVLRLSLSDVPFPPDVIVGSSPHPFGAWAAERLARRFRVPFLFEIRDLWPESLIHLGSVSPLHPVVPIMRSLERALCRRAKRVITVLSRVDTYLTRYGIAPSKVVWLPNFVNLEYFPSPTPPPSDGSFEVMYTGTIGVANLIEVILGAAAVLSDSSIPITLRIVGSGIQEEQIKNHAAQRGLRNIVFEQPKPKLEILQVMPKAQAFVIVAKQTPLYSWGFSPNKLYDYMASCRPIVFGGFVPDNPVAASGCGIVTEPTSEGVARGIRTLAELPLEERYALGLRGRQYVEAHYSVESVGQKFLQILSEIM
jgi:glycosyltransferase involved in cell wall biosynthesis